MPKIKDLGINIVPGTMRPPEIGGGGGGGGWSQCDCVTFRQFGGYGFQTSDCNCVSNQCRPNSQMGQNEAMMQRGGARAMNEPTCDFATQCEQTAACSDCDCVSNRPEYMCACSFRTPKPCLAGSQGTLITPHTPNLAPGVLSREDIANLRAQLKRGLENLEIAEKNLLPKTLEEVDAREKELQRELDALKAHRNELKK